MVQGQGVRSLLIEIKIRGLQGRLLVQVEQ